MINLFLFQIFNKNEITEYMNEFGSEKLKAFFINIDEFLLFKEILEHIKLYDINIFMLVQYV